jgi:hypothetical protein
MAYKADKAIEAIDLRLRLMGSQTGRKEEPPKVPPQDVPPAARDD